MAPERSVPTAADPMSATGAGPRRRMPAWRAIGVVSAVALLLASVHVPTGMAAKVPRCLGLEVTILGTNGDDHLVGTPGDDVIHGMGGNDIIQGRGGDDVICGGSGDDIIYGGAGDDTISGGSGDDIVRGGTGDDRLFGGRGNDLLIGGPGQDTCTGGAGIDTARGCEQAVGTEIGNRPPLTTRPPAGSVALTFDDGPHPQWTPMVLDALARYNVKATFFVVGAKAAAHPGLIMRMIREGHSVQNHTYSHAWLTRYSDGGAATEIARGRNAIRAAAGGVEPRCLRPPFGAVSERIRAVAAAERQAVVMWDVDPQDWRNPNSSFVSRHVLLRTGSGDIVLLHDGSGPTAARSLPAIITGLRDRGLTFTTICG